MSHARQKHMKEKFKMMISELIAKPNDEEKTEEVKFNQVTRDKEEGSWSHPLFSNKKEK